jgi:hypothetical protein
MKVLMNVFYILKCKCWTEVKVRSVLGRPSGVGRWSCWGLMDRATCKIGPWCDPMIGAKCGGHVMCPTRVVTYEVSSERFLKGPQGGCAWRIERRKKRLTGWARPDPTKAQTTLPSVLGHHTVYHIVGGLCFYCTALAWTSWVQATQPQEAWNNAKQRTQTEQPCDIVALSDIDCSILFAQVFQICPWFSLLRTADKTLLATGQVTCCRT